jgi:hypothetical protein
LGHDATLIAADALVGGSRWIILSRRLGTERAAFRLHLQRLREALLKVAPSLIIVVKGRYIPGRWIENIRASLDVPIVNYYPDHPLWPGHTDRHIRTALFTYDEVLTWSDHIAESLAAHGLNCIRVIPFAYDPALYGAPSDDINPEWDVSLIGQFYPSRLSFLLPIADYDLLVSGRGWKQGAAGTPLATLVDDRKYTGIDVCHLYWRSRVAFNIVAPWNAQTHNMRTFEIPAARTAMVTTRTPEHEALFGEDGAILVESPREARSALQALDRDPDRRLAIAREGHRRIRGHTYSERIASLLEKWASKVEAVARDVSPS